MRLKFPHVLILAAAAVLFSTCPAPAEDKRPDNTPPEGFSLLFNGKDLTGWHGVAADPRKRPTMTAEEIAEAQKKVDEQIFAHWSVVDGEIRFDNGGKTTNLCTTKDYANFEMQVDWMIEPKGDSGIYLRGSPQVQIWEFDSPGQRMPPEGSGALFNNQKKENPHSPLVNADHPPGEWNHFDIKMVGEKVTVHLNGKLVTDNVTLENYWERDKPIYPTGTIELQYHHSALRFKNIYIKELK